MFVVVLEICGRGKIQSKDNLQKIYILSQIWTAIITKILIKSWCNFVRLFVL